MTYPESGLSNFLFSVFKLYFHFSSVKTSVYIKQNWSLETIQKIMK